MAKISIKVEYDEKDRDLERGFFELVHLTDDQAARLFRTFRNSMKMMHEVVLRHIYE